MLLGTDRSLFTQGSPLSERMARFAGNTHMVDSIIFSTRAHGVLEPRTITSRLHAYPTRSRSRVSYGLAALRIAKPMPRPAIVSAQAPVHPRRIPPPPAFLFVAFFVGLFCAAGGGGGPRGGPPASAMLL